MSDDLLRAAADAERLATMFAGLIEIGPKLRDFASMQQAADEALARRDAIVAEHEQICAATAEVVAAAEKHLAEIKRQTDDATEELAARRGEADEYVQAKRAAGDREFAKAENDAGELREHAKALAVQVVAAAREEAKGIQDAIADRRAELADLTEQTKAAQAELDTVNDRLAAVARDISARVGR